MQVAEVSMPADEGKEQIAVGNVVASGEPPAKDKENNKGKVTAVLKVNMYCYCDGCVERYYGPVVKKATIYPGMVSCSIHCSLYPCSLQHYETWQVGICAPIPLMTIHGVFGSAMQVLRVWGQSLIRGSSWWWVASMP